FCSGRSAGEAEVFGHEDVRHAAAAEGEVHVGGAVDAPAGHDRGAADAVGVSGERDVAGGDDLAAVHLERGRDLDAAVGHEDRATAFCAIVFCSEHEVIRGRHRLGVCGSGNNDGVSELCAILEDHGAIGDDDDSLVYTRVEGQLVRAV